MGQRANLIVIENGKTEIYYTHHRANTLDRDLFWGPTYALAFIRSQQPITNGELLNEVWAEGAAVMDIDRMQLLWFGGEAFNINVPARRVHHRLMSYIWKEWDIRWASQGVVDVAHYLGREPTTVLSDQKYPPIDLAKLNPFDGPAFDVITLKCRDGVYFFKFVLPVD